MNDGYYEQLCESVFQLNKVLEQNPTNADFVQQIRRSLQLEKRRVKLGSTLIGSLAYLEAQRILKLEPQTQGDAESSIGTSRDSQINFAE